jgi:hypothetical protein
MRVIATDKRGRVRIIRREPQVISVAAIITKVK